MFGESASGYVTYVTDALIGANAANAVWTGGGANTSVLGNVSVGATATQINELNGKWFLGTDLPDDVVRMSGSPAFTISYSAVLAPLYGLAGPSMNDINQGYLGDCFLLSALAEVAHQDQAAIEGMIVNNGDNTYGVRFFVDGVARWVTVNDAQANGETEFNYGSNDWASLVEKAYAQAQAGGVITGNYVNYGNAFSTIGNGGCPEFTLEEITGATAITDFVAAGSSWSKDVYNQNLYYVSGASRLSAASVLSTLVSGLAAGFDEILGSNTNATDSAGRTTLVADHAMSIYGYDSATGNLEVRNPWGSDSWQNWDTTFEVSLATLLTAGDTITVDNAVSPASVVNGALVSAAAGLQANTAITSFSIADTAADVVTALASLGGDTKLVSITLTDPGTPAVAVTSAQYSLFAAVLNQIATPHTLTVTAASVSAATGLQAASGVTGFTVTDSSANVAANLGVLNGDGKLTGITLTDSNPMAITAAQLAADASALGKLPASYTLAVSGVTAATAGAVQANAHVVSFAVTDTAAAVTAGLTALNGDGKLASLTVTGTASADSLKLAGSKVAATIDLGGDTASVKAGLSAPILTFIGSPDAITLGSGAATIAYALRPSSGIETIAGFVSGMDRIQINLEGAANTVLKAAYDTVNGTPSIAIYSSANPAYGVVLTGLSSNLSATAFLAAHTTFNGGLAIIS